MKNKIFIFLIITAFLFFVQKSTFGQNYSRIKIYTDKAGLTELVKNGIPLDFGCVFRGDYLTGEFSEAEIAEIEKLNFEYEVLISDLAQYYSERNNYKYSLEKNKTTPENFNLGSIGGNLSLEELLAELDEMANLYPELITVKQAINDETTHEGRSIYWVKISDNPNTDETDEPEVLYTGLTHAREPVSMMQIIYYMWYLLENYENGGEIQYLVDNLELYFVPCVNPDGYVYNQTIEPNGGGMWRKNLCDNNNDGNFDEFDDGVDLNRNFGYMWGYDDQGSSPDPSDATYRGTSAFSEPETQIIKYFTENHEFVLAQNHHTYSNLLLYPVGYTTIQAADFDLFSTYSDYMTKVNNYSTGTGWELLYPVNGDSNDWMYGELGIIAFTAESGSAAQGFWPNQADILPICETNLEMNLYLSRFALSYAEFNDLSDFYLPKSGSIDFNIQRLGLKEADYVVSIEPLNDCFQNTIQNQTFSGMDTLEIIESQFDYVLNENLKFGDQFSFILNLK